MEITLNIFNENNKCIGQEYLTEKGNWMHRWMHKGKLEKGGWRGRAKGDDELNWRYERVDREPLPHIACSSNSGELETDDMDIRDTKLSMLVGGNGDYYLSLKETKSGKKIKIDTRIAMSGGNATTAVKIAIANLYKALQEQCEQLVCPECDNPNPHISKQGLLSCEECGHNRAI